MGLFSKKAPAVDANGYERKTMRGYADKGPVAKALAEGWEIENMMPVIINGTTMPKQMMFMLKRKAA